MVRRELRSGDRPRVRVELHGLRHRKEKNSVRLGFEDCLRRYVLDAMQHAEVLDVLLHLGPRLRAERAENLTRVLLPLDAPNQLP